MLIGVIGDFIIYYWRHKYMNEDDHDDLFGQAEGECVGCDSCTRVSNLGLCRTCDAKLDRDMIRERDWERSVSAWLLQSDEREALRKRRE